MKGKRFEALLKHGAVPQDKIPEIIDSDIHNYTNKKTSQMHDAGILQPEHYHKIAGSNLADSAQFGEMFSTAKVNHAVTTALTGNEYAQPEAKRALATNENLPKESVEHLAKHFLDKKDVHGLNSLSLFNADKLESHHVEAIHAAYPDSAQLNHLYTKTTGMHPDTYMKLAQKLKTGPVPTARALARNPSLTPQAALELSKHFHPMVAHELSQNETLPRGIRASIERNSGLDDLDIKLLG
jgi:hypothetical protein